MSAISALQEGLQAHRKLYDRTYGVHAATPACLYTFPSFITNSTFSRMLMSFNGSPLTAIRSAYFPGLIEPISLECPSKSAAFDVAAWMACIGVIP